MPISSGALEWPVSYFRKPEVPEIDHSPQGVMPLDYEWQPQLSAREDYEKWRKEMDRKAPLRSRKKTKNDRSCCCCCCRPSTPTKQRIAVIQKPNRVADSFRADNRDDPATVIKRRRRRVCCCLTFWLSLVFLVIAAAVVITFVHFTGWEKLEPSWLVTCSGRWRVHFMAYDKGNNTYVCCYMPDINRSISDPNLTDDPVWPSGYLIKKDACLGPRYSSCQDYETHKLFSPGTPGCLACMTSKSQFLLVVLTCVVAIRFQ